MSQTRPTLHMFCGKIASGKSTLTANLAREAGTVVISEDDWLNALFTDEMKSIGDYVRCTTKLRMIMAPHVVSILRSGVSVILDFQANTISSRAWMRRILEQTGASHVLHVLEVPDEVCLKRLRARNTQCDHPFSVTEEQFWHISSHFVAPSPDEMFNIVVHH